MAPGHSPLKSRLIVREKAASQFRDKSTGEAVARVYLLYEQALSERNSIDFNGLILGDAHFSEIWPVWLNEHGVRIHIG
jgi:superfamily I DNA/RNA helicase